MDIKSTSDIATNGMKILTYGESGAGKTTLIATLPKPLIISNEGGLLSIKGIDLPYIEIKSMADLTEVYTWLKSSEDAQKYESIAIDSLSELSEICLAEMKAELINGKPKDGRMAYGDMAEKMRKVIRAFRDLPKHIYMSAKLDKATDEQGRILYSPKLEGAQLGKDVPYFFDFCFALQIHKDQEGNKQRYLLTEGDGLWTAKQRGYALAPYELPNLGAIIEKVQNG